MNICMIGKNSMKLQNLKKNYSHLNVGNIADADYAHAKRLCKI